MMRRLPPFTGFLLVLMVALPAVPTHALDEPERLRLVGERAFADGLYAVARRALERLAVDYPNDPKLPATLLLLGRARLALGDAESALEAFRRLDKLPAPGSPLEVKFWQGEALLRLRRFAEARAAYEAVARNATFYLARTLVELKRFSDALPILAAFPTKYANHKLAPDAKYLLGWARVTSGDKGGVEDLRAFVTMAPNHELAPAARRLTAQ